MVYFLEFLSRCCLFVVCLLCSIFSLGILKEHQTRAVCPERDTRPLPYKYKAVPLIVHEIFVCLWWGLPPLLHYAVKGVCVCVHACTCVRVVVIAYITYHITRPTYISYHLYQLSHNPSRRRHTIESQRISSLCRP